MAIYHPMWTLKTALDLVRKIQSPIRAFRYHVVVGGGVINKGQSSKDLDLYFMPLFEPFAPDVIGLRAYLETVFGPEYNLGGGPAGGPFVEASDVDAAYPPCPVYGDKRFTYRPNFNGDERRIDVFIC